MATVGFKERTFQKWLNQMPPGSTPLYGNVVRQFGLTTFRTKLRVRDVLMRTGGEPAKLARRLKELRKREKRDGKSFHTLEEQIAELNELVQRSFKGGKGQNVRRIADADAGYIAKLERSPNLPGHFPEVTLVHPEPAYLSHLPVEIHGEKQDVGVGVLYINGPMTILDGQTRQQGFLEYALATGKEWVLDEEVAVCVIPGVPVEVARQVFVTMNSTPVPVGFDDLIERDAMTRAYSVTKHAIERLNASVNGAGEQLVRRGRGGIRKKAVYQFVMQTLLGGAGEAKGAEYRLETDDIDKQTETLDEVIEKAKRALGKRWGNANQLLVGGYGLATIGRLYYETEVANSKKPLKFSEVLDRIAAMSWDVNDERWNKTGVTAVTVSKKDGTTKLVSKLTSYDMIRRVVDIVTSSEWEKYKLRK